jgi:hypothetical protein
MSEPNLISPCRAGNPDFGKARWDDSAVYATHIIEMMDESVLAPIGCIVLSFIFRWITQMNGAVRNDPSSDPSTSRITPAMMPPSINVATSRHDDWHDDAQV